MFWNRKSYNNNDKYLEGKKWDIYLFEFSRIAQSWQCWHLRIKNKSFYPNPNKKSFLRILSDAFELDANVVNFVYYEKTLIRLSLLNKTLNFKILFLYS